MKPSENPNATRIPFGNLKIFNQHDTPPPFLFMEGSCIIEVKFLEDREVTERMTFEAFRSELAEGLRAAAALSNNEFAFIAHVKVVDGSGEMLYRLDNNNKDNISIALSLSRNNQFVGEMRFSISDQLEVSHPETTEIGNAEPAMNKHRIRFRLLDAESKGDIEISGVRVEKITEAGMIPIYSGPFRDLKSKGEELKVMLWFEVSDDHT
jgi:hypothetical protein